MNERNRNIAVGLTALVGLVGLLAMLMLFGYVPAWLEPGYPVQIELPHAAGLNEGSRVHLSGIDIGSIEAVMLQGPAGKGVTVVARIREDVRIPEGARVEVYTPLLGGGPTLEFHVDHIEGQPQAYLDPGETIEGQVPTLVSTFSRELQAALGEPMQELARVSDNFEQLSNEWTQVGENLNQLLSPASPEAVDAGEISATLPTVLARADARLAELEQVLAGLDAYVNDPELREDIEATAANARALTDRVAGSVEQLATSITESVAALRKRYVALADDFAGVAGSLRELTEQAREGEGTLGRLVQDPALYRNLNDTVERMKAALDEMRLLIQKWKAEGVPIQL